MFGRLKIRSPSAGGNVASGQVTLFRERTDDVRIVLSTLTLNENQAFVATARASSKLGFSVDVVRANVNEPWPGEYVTVNWFAWGADVEKSSSLSSMTARGSLPLSNATRIGEDQYLVTINQRLLPPPSTSGDEDISVVASARNENRAQVIAVNLLGMPTQSSFIVKIRRLDDAKALVEEEGTFIDWIASFARESQPVYNRTGSGTRFTPSFPALTPSNQARIIVLHTNILAPSNKYVYASSITLQTVRGFSLSRSQSIKQQHTGGALQLPERDQVMYLAWEGLVDECDGESTCSHRGSCVWSTEPLEPQEEDPHQQQQPLLSKCACRSPWSGYECDEECPLDPDDLLVCSGNGFCSQTVPECECFSGWTGDLCNSKAYSADSRVVLLSLLVIFLAVGGCFAFWFTSRCRRRLLRARRLLQLRRALIGEEESTQSNRRGAGPGEQFAQIDQALNGDAASWAIPFEKLNFGAQIGQGSSSQVFIGLWASQTVAIKKIAVPRMRRKNAVDPHLDFWLYFKREAGFLSTLHHPNIVRFFGVASSSQLRGFTDYFYLVTELCVACLSDIIRGPVLTKVPSVRLKKNPSSASGGALMNVSSLNEFLLTTDDAEEASVAEFIYQVLAQIACGMEFLHSKGVVHRDLKCDNVLLDSENRVKLCDFGISRVVDQSKGYLQGTTAMIATPAFMAPELITTGSYPCGTKVDVYSFGIVFWSFILWKEPYVELQQTHSVFDLMSRITTQGLRPGIHGQDWSRALEQFYFACVDVDPAKRPAFKDILKLFDRTLKPDIEQAWLKTYAKAYPAKTVLVMDG